MMKIRRRDLVTTVSLTAAAIIALSSHDNASVRAFDLSELNIPGFTSFNFKRTLGNPVLHDPE
jgi:hypothetical protein